MTVCWDFAEDIWGKYGAACDLYKSVALARMQTCSAPRARWMLSSPKMDFGLSAAASHHLTQLLCRRGGAWASSCSRVVLWTRRVCLYVATAKKTKRHAVAVIRKQRTATQQVWVALLGQRMHREKNKGGWCHPHSKLVWSFKKNYIC
jgi:hypothetical protein